MRNPLILYPSASSGKLLTWPFSLITTMYLFILFPYYKKIKQLLLAFRRRNARCLCIIASGTADVNRQVAGNTRQNQNQECLAKNKGLLRYLFLFLLVFRV